MSKLLTTILSNLTVNETKAYVSLVKTCLHAMGGDTPKDLDNDLHTWADAEDLQPFGWSKHEAAGTFAALSVKGVVCICSDGNYLAGSGYHFIELDKYWSDLNKVK